MVDEASLSEKMLGELRELLADNFNELINRYVTDSQTRFELLQKAVAELDFKTIHFEAHGIKGSSRNMGANLLAEIMGELEALGYAQNSQNLESLFTAAQLEFIRVVEGLDRHRVA
jgi:histidine phosphotransfer protein HptB